MMHDNLVFVTKYRRDVFTKEILDDLCGTFTSVCADFEAERVEFDGESDHVLLRVERPAEGGRLGAGEQPKRCFQPHDPQEELSEHQKEAVERRSVVAVLLRRKLWRRAHRNHPPIHRTTADASLKAKARTATLSALCASSMDALLRVKVPP